jgi:hypothetical protein
MSISSEIAARRGNKVKTEWENELRDAYEARNWKKVRIILEKIEEFFFSE